MKISWNWLKEYVDTDLSPEKAAELLTACGLEVESVEKFETVKGGLEGVVIGEVKTKEKHPDADRLSVTTVDVGAGALLNIVCGAANVAAGQKVAVAMVGSTLYPTAGEPIHIKKSKIRGAVSEGMICAEDEIGLGASHEGIMVLDANAKIGTPAREYFKIATDYVLEIGLTPNRADAASHIGVARDLVAVLGQIKDKRSKIKNPSIGEFRVDDAAKVIEVKVEDTTACPRYSGLTLSGISVKESPSWLKDRLAAIGLRSINNVVDITNFVLHELGQPLHAFDADKIKGGKVIVKKLAEKTKFTTLDGTVRELSANDLMICDASGGMCIAGVFGGIESGVTEKTTSVFLESAYFDPVHIRKTSNRHGLKTDASFRFERGTDPNITVHALKRAAMLIKEVAGGKISSEVTDTYPQPVEHFKVAFSYQNCDKLIGKQIDREVIKSILESLEIGVTSEGSDALLLSVPPYRVDVKREADVVEEVLRIYGYNNVELPASVRSSLSYVAKPDPEKVQDVVSDLLSSNGFSEIFTNSLTKGDYYSDQELSVKLLNPLSADLNVMRRNLLFTGLEAIVHNRNRKNDDLRFYEFGKTYRRSQEPSKKSLPGYAEEKHLAIFITGRREEESWNASKDASGFFTLKGVVEAVCRRLGLSVETSHETTAEHFSEQLTYLSKKKQLVTFGKVSPALLKKFDIKGDVYYADFSWDNVLALLKGAGTLYSEVPRFPEVRRDLALLIDRTVKYEQLEQIAYHVEKNLLKRISLFDVYEGDKVGEGKKSYALSFILQDEHATLTDKQIDKVMEKLMSAYKEKVNAVIRSA